MKLKIAGLILCGALVQSCSDTRKCNDAEAKFLDAQADSMSMEQAKSISEAKQVEMVLEKSEEVTKFTEASGTNGACAGERGAANWSTTDAGLKLVITPNNKGVEAAKAELGGDIQVEVEGDAQGFAAEQVSTVEPNTDEVAH